MMKATSSSLPVLHSKIQRYSSDAIPLDQDLFLISETWLTEWVAAITKICEGTTTDYPVIGFVSYAAARVVHPAVIDLSWYPNIYDRFHEVAISLDRSQIVDCIGCWEYDFKPMVFVKQQWLEDLHLKSYSVFAMIDAIGVKAALRSGLLSYDRLVSLRGRIDKIATSYAGLAFVSFADSLIIKANWNVGLYGSTVAYSYHPERIFHAIREIRCAYREIMGMEIYAVLTQGANEYSSDGPLHISPAMNHVSLNSLGIPFAQLQAIDDAARSAIRTRAHIAAEVYMDKTFFQSLSLDSSFDRENSPAYSYNAPLIDGARTYVTADFDALVKSLPPV